MKNCFATLCFLLLSNIFVYGDQHNSEAWTWLYQKNMSADEMSAHHDKDELVYMRDSEPFSQLVFSWNALRPEHGYFSFWVQARDKDRDSWGMWHKMMEWGSDVQRSFMTPADTFARYVHVRFETNPNRLSNAFRIKIKAHEGADLTYFKNFSVALSNFSAFSTEIPDALRDLASVYVHKVPKYSQMLLDHPRNEALCSPTSMSMLTGYLLKEPIDAVQFAERSYDSGLGVYGSWPFNIAHAYERCNGAYWFAAARFNSFKHLHGWLHKDIPVVVSVRGPLRGAPRPFAQGHLLVVVGYDAKKQEVVCHDPAFESLAKTRKRYALKDFLEAWDRSRRLVYLAGPLQA